MNKMSTIQEEVFKMQFMGTPSTKAESLPKPTRVQIRPVVLCCMSFPLSLSNCLWPRNWRRTLKAGGGPFTRQSLLDLSSMQLLNTTARKRCVCVCLLCLCVWVSVCICRCDRFFTSKPPADWQWGTIYMRRTGMCGLDTQVTWLVRFWCS